ncbi:MAG: sulfite exporter TauE/SafE family protein [Actinomycetota bacterium]|nr:sulfite exporter TauE/SafE family protein [Actinomycetota bacterium]MDQ3920941.1 sulfite exporter TauE/SafE family protein [Actinomycetota bacterium]
MAASLVVVIFSSLSGTIRNIRSKDLINWRNAALLASTVAPTSLMGMAISCFSADVVAKLAFATLLVVLTYPMVRGRPPFAKTSFKVPTVLVLVAGVGIGTLSGLVGIGGGVLMIPLMVLGLGTRTKTAVSTTLIAALATGVVGPPDTS